MGLTILKFTDAKEELALARQRESQSAEETTDSAATSSPPSAAPSPAPPAHDHVGHPLPRGSRLPDRESSGSEPISITYTVQRGDTLRGIADWFYGDRERSEEIFAANRSTIHDPERLEPGTVLHIPRHGGATKLS